MKFAKIRVSCQVAFTYIGAIVGAGFASGQELLKFFSVFGTKGMIGAALAGILFGLFGLLVMRIVSEEKVESYDQLLKSCLGKRIVPFIDGLVGIFLFASLAVMFVAGGSLFHQLWGFPLWGGFLLTALVVYLFLLIGTEGVLWFNTALMPGLIILTLVIAGISLQTSTSNMAAPVKTEITEVTLVGDSWLLAALLYVAYNFILGAVILSSLGHTAKAGGKIGVLVGGAILGLMTTVMSYALLNAGVAETEKAIPMLMLAKKIHPLIGWSYSVVLWIAILTTAMSLTLGLVKRLQSFIILTRGCALVLIFLPTLTFLFCSFSQMVAVIYPLMGYLGVIFLLIILRKSLPDRLFFK